jgi:hypothetical protein
MRDGQQAAEDDVNDSSKEDDDHEADDDDRQQVAEDDVNDADDDSEADDDHEDDGDDRQPITEPDENQTEASASEWISLGQSSNEETMNDLSGLLITIDYPPLQEEKTNESKPKLLKRWSNWRFPNVDWTQGLNHFRTHISGLPNDYSIMEMPDYFPLISYVRVSTDDKNNIRWHFRYPGLPGKKSEDYNSNEVTREFIDFCFIPTFVERALNEVDRWVRVLFIDYDLDQDYEGMSAGLRSQYFFWGKPSMLKQLQHRRFTYIAWLTKEITAVYNCFKRRYDTNQSNALVPTKRYFLLPCNCYFFGCLDDDTGKGYGRTLRIRSDWLGQNIEDWILALVVHKSGNWIAIEDANKKSVYQQMIQETDDVPASIKKLRKVEMKNVIGRNDKTLKTAQVTHLMYRRYNYQLMVDTRMDLELPPTFKYDYDKGWFFALSKRSPKKGRLARYAWCRENFHKSFLEKLQKHQGTWMQVPVGRYRKKRTEQTVPKLPANVDLPIVKYYQGKRQSCLFDSMASALFFIQLKRTAQMLHDQAVKSVRLGTTKERVALMKNVFLKHDRWLVEKKVSNDNAGNEVFVKNHSEYGYNKLDVFANQSNCPTMAILQSTDGACNHGVTLVGDWIFDSNEDHALRVSIESLNICAQPKFQCVFYAIRFGKNE